VDPRGKRFNPWGEVNKVPKITFSPEEGMERDGKGKGISGKV